MGAVIEGWVVVDGYLPDGDTVRFVPARMKEVLALPRAHLVRPGKDTSVSVRLEGIDAPELHYAGAQQPAAKPALERLLREIGWPPEAVGEGPGVARVPRGVLVQLVTSACDAHGRVIAYLYDASPAGNTLPRVADSVNARLVDAGVVYPLAYDSQPARDARLFRELAGGARRAGRGVWARDRTRKGVALRSEGSLGPYGSLVLPKVFRRTVTYFREAAAGVGFCEWLRDWSGVDDRVRTSRGRWCRLSDVVRDRGGVIRVVGDPLSMTFAS